MKTITMDGNQAVAYISYALSEIAVIYPITPASPMAELADEWSASGKQNLFGQVPKVVEMQSEGGAAGALHGCISCGGLATTYTCSQGLLLMMPDMYKIAGELLPTVIHVSARAIATHALNIFGDHQDVMACRQTGFVFLSSSTVQEALDFALIAHLGALKSSLPFLHFFDGFRTSHEICKVERPDYDEIKSLLCPEDIHVLRMRALDPDHPVQRGTAQNPDTYFQNREAANQYYQKLPAILEEIMERVAKLTGRVYRAFDYFGATDAEHVLVFLGSGGITARETVKALQAKGDKVGVVQVRLYRPFDADRFFATLPKSCKTVTALDRTKEAGSLGEPLYLDVCVALQEKGATHVRVYGGRYGLGGKEFTPADCLAVFQNAQSQSPKNHFTVGITDDVTGNSLTPPSYALPFDGTACIFYGLGSDGTVGANKNSIKILGDNTDLFVQGYFCYDSRKSGGTTISHLRFASTPIHAPYLIEQADFIACHNPSYLGKYEMFAKLKTGGTVLLNCPWTDLPTLETHLPSTVKRQLALKKASLYVIDATSMARENGLAGKTSTIMQAAFFLLHQNLLPFEKAKALLLDDIKRKYASKGDTMVEMNTLCVQNTAQNVEKIDYPTTWVDEKIPTKKAKKKLDYFHSFMHPILTLKGDSLPVSAFSPDGSVPTNTARLEKHGEPNFLPKWIPENCIQCNQCAFVCPHACIRPFLIAENAELPDSYKALPAIGAKGGKFHIQVSPMDCMGCGLCARTCPSKKKALVMVESPLPNEREHWELSLSLPKADNTSFKRDSVKGSQFYQPLFEFSYACAGCGETPYIKLLTQLFGERLFIANATGCSSIYGGSSPTCPYATNEKGQGPAWANSLFEDNAEFGLGMRLALNAREITRKSVWIVGGDGFAYDIGYGGLDHVLATGANVNILVLDSEVYSNTGGQSSKATPLGAIARFASQGKGSKKKDLGLMAITYGNVYVAQVSMGADKTQLIKAFTEAEKHEGVSLIIAYSPCIAHGMYMGRCMEEEKRAVDSGYWTLYRFDPTKETGKFILDSKAATLPLLEFLEGENRFARLKKERPERANELFHQAETENREKRRLYEALEKFFKEE